jgi:integrase
MPKKTTPLNDKQISKAKPMDKDYKIADGDGLYIRIRSGGTKDWLFRYLVPHTKKRTDMSFGIYPLITLADARELRLTARTQLANGIDPKAFKKQSIRAIAFEKANTLETVMNEWLIIKATKVSPDHANDIKRSLALHVLPAMGQRAINEINAPEMIEILKPIQAKGNFETIRRLCQRLNECMNFAVNTGLITINPLSQINAAFQAPTKQNLPTIKPDELPVLLQTINRASIKIVTKCLIEWQLHTMVRPSEAATAEWTDIDLKNKVWVIPADKMKKTLKAKEKSDKPHTVPLTDQTIALLDFIKPISGHRKYVFPADRDPKRHANEQSANMALKRMGYENKLVAHGLRALASTTQNEQGFDADVIESCLAHVDKNEVRRAYNRAEYLERRRVLMQWWSNHIEQAANGNVSLAGGIKTLRLINE